MELVSLAAIALAILFGGPSLLATIARSGPFAIAAFLVLGFFQVMTLRRNFAARTAFSRLLVTRDTIFMVAIGCSIAYVAHPAKWAYGAAIAATEFGLILEVLARVGPGAAVVAGNARQSSAEPPKNDAS